ncbi:PREDICTED: uncharacterized protein LOC102245908, partial [Myotis brandtii]|uniref:uncharacterized protein LOC102245908 n=1 Tax=Myotis brandtii TaxID=109478 RepID=UPI0007041F4B
MGLQAQRRHPLGRVQLPCLLPHHHHLIGDHGAAGMAASPWGPGAAAVPVAQSSPSHRRSTVAAPRGPGAATHRHLIGDHGAADEEEKEESKIDFDSLRNKFESPQNKNIKLSENRVKKFDKDDQDKGKSHEGVRWYLQNEHTRQSNKTSPRQESMEQTQDSQRHDDKLLKILENLQEKIDKGDQDKAKSHEGISLCTYSLSCVYFAFVFNSQGSASLLHHT